MDKPILQAGDEFGEFSHHLLAHGINFFQAAYAKDHNAVYNHTGIIQDEEGKTLQALWTVSEPNFFKATYGHQIIIARYLGCDIDRKKLEIANLKRQHLGQWYPWWRIFMHTVPPLAKISVFKRPVCSELTARYEWFIEASTSHWAGRRPDNLVDDWNRRSGDDYQIIYEGMSLWQL